MESSNLEPTAASNQEGWKIAKTGIDLLLNNRIDEAEKLFKTNFDNIQTAAGYSFLTFIVSMVV